MSKIVETNFGTLVDSKRVARGSASNVTKKGAFYVFSIRVENDDIREYSFTDRARAEQMREILISHLETRISKKIKKSNSLLIFFSSSKLFIFSIWGLICLTRLLISSE